jgi:nitrous oxide reductase
MNGNQEQSPLGCSRRRFLGGAASAVAAGALGAGLVQSSSAAAAAGQRWKMRLSGSSINFTALPIEQACERLAA